MPPNGLMGPLWPGIKHSCSVSGRDSTELSSCLDLSGWGDSPTHSQEMEICRRHSVYMGGDRVREKTRGRNEKGSLLIVFHLHSTPSYQGGRKMGDRHTPGGMARVSPGHSAECPEQQTKHRQVLLRLCGVGKCSWQVCSRDRKPKQGDTGCSPHWHRGGGKQWNCGQPSSNITPHQSETAVNLLMFHEKNNFQVIKMLQTAVCVCVCVRVCVRMQSA